MKIKPSNTQALLKSYLAFSAMICLTACDPDDVDGPGQNPPPPDVVYGDGVVDIDGNEYLTVIIGEQEWMAQNLRTTHFQNGDEIPEVTSGSEWLNFNVSTKARSFYNNNPENGPVYGMIYSMGAANDYGPSWEPKICPNGWRVPSAGDWEELAMFLGGPEVAGGRLKMAGTSLWNAPNTGATDDVGFAAVPGGSRSNGNFVGLGTQAAYWVNDAGRTSIRFDEAYFSWSAVMNSSSGACIRCIRID